MPIIDTLIENLSAEYKTDREVTAECQEQFHIGFHLEDDGTVSYDDEWLVYQGFKSLDDAIADCLNMLKDSAKDWAYDTCEVDLNTLQIGWAAFESTEEWGEGDIGMITFTIAMEPVECDGEEDDEE